HRERCRGEALPVGADLEERLCVDRRLAAGFEHPEAFRVNHGVVADDRDAEAGDFPGLNSLGDVRVEPGVRLLRAGDAGRGRKRDRGKSKHCPQSGGIHDHLVMLGLLIFSTSGSGKQLCVPYTPPNGYAVPGVGLSGTLYRRMSPSRCPSRESSRRRSSMIWFFTSAAVNPVAENVGNPGCVARAALMAAAAAARSFAATFASATMS